MQIKKLYDCYGTIGSPQYCTDSPRSNVKLGLIRYDQVVKAGSNFVLSIPVISTSYIFSDCCTISIFDRDTQTFIYQTNLFGVDAGSSSLIDITLNMPNKPVWNLHISVTDEGFITTTCEDFTDITVTKYDETQQYHNVCDAGNVCRQVIGPGVNQCSVPGSTCYGVGSSCPNPSDMPIFGICVPKNMILIGAIATLYMLTRK